jgi:TM2 domain-containing membrane protein YozV
VAPREGDFEQRFLDFAFKTNLPISAVTVAYALKIPIKDANEGLEDLAARDVLLREVDEQGGVTFQLPGRQQIASEINPIGQSTALSPYAQPPPLLYEPSTALSRTPPESTALAGLLVNVLFVPGLGSLIGGKTNAGIFQLLMFLLGIPLCLSIIGLVIGGPMVMGAWIWGLVSGVNMLSEAKAASQQRQLAG